MSDEEHHFESKADAGASKTYPQQAGTIRKNGYIVIKGRPCKVRFPIDLSLVSIALIYHLFPLALISSRSSSSWIRGPHPFLALLCVWSACLLIPFFFCMLLIWLNVSWIIALNWCLIFCQNECWRSIEFIMYSMCSEAFFIGFRSVLLNMPSTSCILFGESNGNIRSIYSGLLFV